MSRKSPLLALVLSFALLALLDAAPAHAQQAWSIMGTVQTSHGELPDRRILVTLQFRGNTIGTTFCDSEGKFSFSQLMPNPYHVLVDDEKYRPVEVVVDVNPLMTAPAFVRINLTPRENAKLDNPAPGSNPNLVNSAELATACFKNRFGLTSGTYV